MSNKTTFSFRFPYLPHIQYHRKLSNIIFGFIVFEQIYRDKRAKWALRGKEAFSGNINSEQINSIYYHHCHTDKR